MGPKEIRKDKSQVRISYLADEPDLGISLIPALLEQWRDVTPEDTWAARAERLRAHMNTHTLPIAWIAQEDGVAMGMAALRMSDLHGREELGPWLGGVYVRPEFRHRGVASALCHVVAEKARELGFSRLFLFTLDQQALYARLGWGVLENTVWKGRSIDIMVKDLDDGRQVR